MAETKARFLANLIGADNTANDFTLPNVAVSGTNDKVLTSGGDGTVAWEVIELSPTTTSISPTEVESADDQTTGGNQTFTLTGENYATSGMTVELLGTSGSNITSGITVTHGTATSFTITLARNLFVDTNEPYSVKVTKSSGLTHTLSDAIRVDNAPSFTASPNTIVASIEDNVSNATHATIAATDAESDTITFEEVGTTLYNKFTSATPRGVQSDGTIKGVPVGVSGDETTTFTVRAKSTGDGGATEKQTDQNFRFTITNYVPPYPFNGLTYVGDADSTGRAISFPTGNDFEPDLVWIKHRSSGEWHEFYDSIRGGIKSFPVNDSFGEFDRNNGLQSFDSDGFTVKQDGAVNGSGINYVAWSWRTGASSTASIGNSNTHVSGATNISQRASTKEGFSITKFTGSGNGGNFPHNLGGTPDWVFIKNLAGDTNNPRESTTWHSGNSGKYGHLSTNGSFGNRSASYFPTAPDSDKIYFGTNNQNGGSSDTFMCYAWKAVTGHSDFGTYTVSSSDESALSKTVSINDNTLTPKLIILKSLQTGNWYMFDSFRGFGTNNSGSGAAGFLRADVADAEGTPGTSQDYVYDVTAGSFKVRGDRVGLNHNAQSPDMMYMVFA